MALRKQDLVEPELTSQDEESVRKFIKAWKLCRKQKGATTAKIGECLDLDLVELLELADPTFDVTASNEDVIEKLEGLHAVRDADKVYNSLRKLKLAPEGEGRKDNLLAHTLRFKRCIGRYKGGTDLNDETLARLYVESLRPVRLKDLVRDQQLKSFKETVSSTFKLVEEIETLYYRFEGLWPVPPGQATARGAEKGPAKAPAKPSKAAAPEKASTSSERSADDQKSRPRCARCGYNNHVAKDCTNVMCSHCNKWGHVEAKCFTKHPDLAPKTKKE